MPRHALIPLIVACALFMENLDSTVIATSLPAIARDLGEDPIALKLALTSYFLSLAVFIPLSGWMADRYGAKAVFRAAIGVFMLGSILCGVSSSLTEFVLARIVQGMGGAMMTPVGRLIILRSIPKSQLIGSLAWLTVPALAGPVAGPPLGGYITTYFDWRWIFFINVPISLLGFALATRYFETVQEPEPPPLDRLGVILSAAGLSGLVFGFATLGQELLPLSLSIGIAAAGAVAMALYVSHALRAEHPVIDLRLLRIPTFFAGIAGASLFRTGIGALPFLLPLMLQLGFGMTPFQSGMITFAGAVGAIAMKFTAPPILRCYGFRSVLLWNALISAGFLALNAVLTPETPHWVIILALLTGGFFRSLQFTAINAIAYADIGPQDMSRATSFASVAQQVSLSAGVAIGGLMLEAAQSWRGDATIQPGDFIPAFILIAAISGLSAFVFAKLTPGAGAELTGRQHAEQVRAEVPH